GNPGSHQDPETVDDIPFRVFIQDDRNEHGKDDHDNCCQVGLAHHRIDNCHEYVDERQEDRDPDDGPDHLLEIVFDQHEQERGECEDDGNKDDRVGIRCGVLEGYDP